MKEIDRCALGNALTQEAKIIKGRGRKTYISEAYVQLIAGLASGHFNQELLKNPLMVNEYVKKMQEAGIQVPDMNGWSLTPMQRRILTVIDAGVRERERIIDEVGDMSRSSLSTHLGEINKQVPLAGRVKGWRKEKPKPQEI